jgi:hypothetical protein
MMVIFEATAERGRVLHLAPSPESVCLASVRRYKEEGPFALTVKPIETRGESVTGRAIEIHCSPPRGERISTHERSSASEMEERLKRKD